MAERRSSGTRSAGSTRKASGSTKSRSSSASRSKSTTKPKPKAKTTSTAKKKTTAAKQPDLSGKSVADLRNALSRGAIGPLNHVMLTRARMGEVWDDAVSRGRMTADDAHKLAQDLINRGRKQTDDVLADLEGLLTKAGDVSSARKRGSEAASRARRQVTE